MPTFAAVSQPWRCFQTTSKPLLRFLKPSIDSRFTQHHKLPPSFHISQQNRLFNLCLFFILLLGTSNSSVVAVSSKSQQK